jgi:hypothetical protein
VRVDDVASIIGQALEVGELEGIGAEPASGRRCGGPQPRSHGGGGGGAGQILPPTSSSTMYDKVRETTWTLSNK